MIEDKKMGVKIALSQEQAMWFRMAAEQDMVLKQTEQRIKQTQKELKLTDREIVRDFRAGAKKSIDSMKNQLVLQKEIKKLADSKVKEITEREGQK